MGSCPKVPDRREGWDHQDRLENLDQEGTSQEEEGKAYFQSWGQVQGQEHRRDPSYLVVGLRRSCWVGKDLDRMHQVLVEHWG
jgi:hypothetical protein